MIFDLLRVGDWREFRLLPLLERFPSHVPGFPSCFRIEWGIWALWLEQRV